METPKDDWKQKQIEKFYSKTMSYEQTQKAKELRRLFHDTALEIMEALPEGRYRNVVLNSLETAAMYATKSITHEWKEEKDDA